MAGIMYIIAILLVSLYLLYRWALPKPLPGIPYNKEATRRLLGDIPDLAAEVKKHGDLYVWFRDQNQRSGSVMHQVFMVPFGPPAIILADAREARDMLVHRGADFDRSYHVRNLLRPLIGPAQITLPTGPDWKRLRRLGQDTMSARFLNGVAAPNIHASCEQFVALWRCKAALAAGRPFDAEMDMFHTALDGVMAFTFGAEYPDRAIQPQLEVLQTLVPENIQREEDMDAAVIFPHTEIPSDLESIIQLVERLEVVQAGGLQQIGWFFEKMTKRFKTLQKTKDALIQREITTALEKLAAADEITSEDSARHGVDLILNRERIMAGKEKRQPDYFGESVRAEVFGLIVGGHDTSSATMCWSVKMLSVHPEAQTKLREHLQSGYAAALAEKRTPTAQEVSGTPIPYLDAVVEELFRLCAVVPMNSREAVRDTQLLGVAVPKGTLVMHLSRGPGFTTPAYAVDESVRGEKARRRDGKQTERVVGAWDDDDIAEFRPERWFVPGKKDGERVFDASAGPSNSFGMGTRSCFGRRLAYINFRLLLVSIIWNFELLPCPEALSSPLGKMGVVYKPQSTYVRLKQVQL